MKELGKAEKAAFCRQLLSAMDLVPNLLGTDDKVGSLSGVDLIWANGGNPATAAECYATVPAAESTHMLAGVVQLSVDSLGAPSHRLSEACAQASWIPSTFKLPSVPSAKTSHIAAGVAQLSVSALVHTLLGAPKPKELVEMPPLRYRGTARTADGQRVLVACQELQDTVILVTWVEPHGEISGTLELSRAELLAGHTADALQLTPEDKIAACEAKVASFVNLGALAKPAGQAKQEPAVVPSDTATRAAALSDVTVESLLISGDGPAVNLEDGAEEPGEGSKPILETSVTEEATMTATDMAVLSARADSVTSGRSPLVLRKLHTFPSGERAMVAFFERGEDQLLAAATMVDGRSAQLGVDVVALERFGGIPLLQQYFCSLLTFFF